MSSQQYVERAIAYAQRVHSGAEVAGRLERLACARFLRDLDQAGTDAFPYVLDRSRANRACRFIELLPHIKGEWAKPVWVDGKSMYAKIKLEDWQVFVEAQLFGWKHVVSGHRRFRRSYEEVARKNAKSALTAAVGLYCLTCEGENGPQVRCAAWWCCHRSGRWY